MTSPIISKLGGLGVDIKLHNTTSNDQIYWTRRHKNSYVLVPADDDKPSFTARFVTPAGRVVNLLSINGLGEIRWPVCRYQVQDEECRECVAHFGLSFKE